MAQNYYTRPASFLVTISTEHDAFDGDPKAELARMLRELAERLDDDSGETFDHFVTLRDVNGNACGRAKYFQPLEA